MTSEGRQHWCVTSLWWWRRGVCVCVLHKHLQVRTDSQSKLLRSCRVQSRAGLRKASPGHLCRRDLPHRGPSDCPPEHSRAWPVPGIQWRTGVSQVFWMYFENTAVTSPLYDIYWDIFKKTKEGLKCSRCLLNSFKHYTMWEEVHIMLLLSVFCYSLVDTGKLKCFHSSGLKLTGAQRMMAACGPTVTVAPTSLCAALLQLKKQTYTLKLHFLQRRPIIWNRHMSTTTLGHYRKSWQYR